MRKVRVFHHQIDGLLLREFARAEVAGFVGGAALVEKQLEMRFVDQTFEQLARGRLFCEIVFDHFDAFVSEVGDRLPAGRSTRLEVDIDFLHGAAAMISLGILIDRWR